MDVWSGYWRTLLVLGASAALAACGSSGNNDDPDSGWPPVVVYPDGGFPTDGGDNVPRVVVSLRADVNRDGIVSITDDSDEAGKADWTAERGAIFLANIDDDLGQCPYGPAYSDIELAECNDAADEIINGDEDLLDLAYLRTVPWPAAPDGTVGSIHVSNAAAPYVRLFFSDGDSYSMLPPGHPVQAPFLRQGLELAIEGTDVVRDPEIWDGFVDVTFRVDVPEGHGDLSGTHTDTVRMRISPVMTFHHLLPAEQLYVTRIGNDADSVAFVNSLDVLVAQSLGPKPHRINTWDQWTQDFFETAYMSMPKVGGQHVIRVNIRSANVWYPTDSANPLRDAGREVFAMRGRNVAALQQFTRSKPADNDTLDSFGNTETIPPYTHNGVSYPMGRSYRGYVPSFYPDRSFMKMMEAQKVQPPVYVDTSWLLVAHVDETISFLKANTPRGWVVLANDPTLARQMLEAEVAKGNGAVEMFVGKKSFDRFGREVSATRTISQVLADTAVMAESAASAVEVDAQLAILKQQTGITDAEIVRVPFLHEKVYGASVAYQPGTVNLLVVNDSNVVVADPFGPMIQGQDIFKVHLEAALGEYGYTIRWIDDWNLYHRNLGEVHCATNATRAIPEALWWESGR
jgi:protein-arginine deiminase